MSDGKTKAKYMYILPVIVKKIIILHKRHIMQSFFAKVKIVPLKIELNEI